MAATSSTILASFGAGLREVFTLRNARARVASYESDRLERLRNEKKLASVRLTAARRIADPFTALDLLRVAADHARAAQELAQQGELDVIDVPASPPTFAQAEAMRDDVELAVGGALRRVEARTLAEIDGLRIGRAVAVLLTALFIGVSLARAYGAHDVARDKPVSASSVRDGTPEALVDGRTRGTFALQTNEQAHPTLTIDLQRTYRIRKIRVFNRGDGWFDEVLPLSIELSSDGTSFHEVARRTEHFDVWTIDLADDARYVRATKESGYIALNEIEVYARE